MTYSLKQDVLLEVERINELELALTIFNSQRALSLVDKKLIVKKLGESTLLIDSASPRSIYYNRIKGFGKNDIDKIDQMLAIYDSEQITPCFDMAPDKLNIEVAQVLMHKGFCCAEQLAFLEISPQFDHHEVGEIEIVKVTEQNVEEFLHLVALSNEMEFEEEWMERKATYFFQQNFQNYIAYVANEAVGIGSLFLKGEEGYIANDFTFPLHRGKGIQKALLHHRMQAAKEMGLKKVFTDVEFGSISHNNMLKLGFQTVFINSFWMKAE